MSDAPPKLAKLFDSPPAQWGLRGDPELWLAMRGLFAGTPMPLSPAELEVRVAQAFQALCSRPLSSDQCFRVPRFERGGMSNGAISPQFWRDRALPMLKKRWELQAEAR
jgi:hypothetical protein